MKRPRYQAPLESGDNEITVEESIKVVGFNVRRRVTLHSDRDGVIFWWKVSDWPGNLLADSRFSRGLRAKRFPKLDKARAAAGRFLLTPAGCREEPSRK